MECRDWQTKEESHYRHGKEYVSIKHRSKHMVNIAEKKVTFARPATCAGGCPPMQPHQEARKFFSLL